MQKSYFRNYLNIYFWQGLSIVLNLLSMFIVSPRLTSLPAIYGIYSICTSLSIFLSYADLGFGSAGYKFASESFARNDRQEESSIIGFVNFISLVLILGFIVVVLGLSINPAMLISDLIDQDQIQIARVLLIILALSSPLTILNRVVNMIFGIRLEDFISNRVNVVTSLFKILSVLYFFTDTKFDIVGYFLFSQIMTLISIIICFSLIKKKYQYDFRLLFKNFRFSKIIFQNMKHLALNSLIVNLIFIFVYELDLLFIGKWAGAEGAAIYSNALTIQNALRTLYGALFSPFLARFNHFIGINDNENLQKTFYSVLLTTLPLTVFPVLGLMLFMEPFVLSWVGPNFTRSILIIQILIFTHMMNFITTPTNSLVYSHRKIKPLYIINVGALILNWTIVLLGFSVFNINAFAIAKLSCYFLGFFYYVFYAFKFLQLTQGKIMKNFIIPIFCGIGALVLYYFIIVPYLPTEKSILNLLMNGVVIGIGICVGIFFFFIFSTDFKQYVKETINQFLHRNVVTSIETQNSVDVKSTENEIPLEK